MTLEKIHDDEISPLIIKIVEICKKNKIPMHTTFSFKNGKFCTTHLEHDEVDPAMRILYYAAFTRGNVDTLISTLIKDAKKHGHTSIYMELLIND